MDELDLDHILLIEAIVLLVALAILLGGVCLRFRQRLKLALEKYRELRMEFLSFKQKSLQQNASPPSQDLMLAYIDREISSAASRYDQYAQHASPVIAENHPLGANVAALRHLYLSCEKEFIQSQENSFMGWAFFEKRLAEVVRRFATGKARQQQVRSNRTRLLQERIDALKPYETENKTLIRKLQQMEKRQKQLETSEREGRRLIAQLKKMLAELKAEDRDSDAAEQKPAHSRSAVLEESSIQAVARILDQNEQVRYAGQQLLDELHRDDAGLTAAQRQKLEETVKVLEMELFKSNSGIAQLQKQLKDSQTEINQKAAELYNARADMRDQGRKLALQGTVLEVQITNPEPQVRESAQLTPEEYFNPRKVLAEIRQLRENNKAQRYIIIALQTQIDSLKESISATASPEVKEAQARKVEQLERMVKEFQLCVETLESEVDNLYNQLQNKVTRYEAGHPADSVQLVQTPVPAEQKALEQEIEQLKVKLEQAIKQFKLSQSLNQFAQQLFACNKLDEVAKLCIQLLREWQTLAGFYLRSELGNADYFGAKVFSDDEKKMVKSTLKRELVTNTKAGLLFCVDRMHLLLSQPPEDEQYLAQLVKGFSAMVHLVNAQLLHLEMVNSQSSRAGSLDSWIKTTKRQLSDLDIQYAFLMEESRNTFDGLSSELRLALDAMGLKGGARAAMENALDECQSRISLLLSTGAVVDREIAKLVEHMNNVQS